MNCRVVVACSGKFHAFSLAEQLQKHQLLHRFFTSYAYQKNTFWRRWVSRMDGEDIDPGKIRTLIPVAVAQKLIPKPFLWNEIFDRWVALQLRLVGDFDLFVGWSGMSAHSISWAKSKGKTTIVTRGSSHILTQEQILKEEYARYGIPFSIDPRTIRKELREYELADYIAVPSEFAYQSFLEQGVPEEKLFLNNLAVELSFGAAEKKAPEPFPPLRVLYMGHLSPRKGISYLLEAFKLLHQEGLAIELWLVGGSTPEMEVILAKHPLPTNVKRIGHVPRNLLSNYIQQCHIGVMPSLEEGLSKVVPEMLIHGLPVIATFNSGGSDIIREGENGLIIPIRSPEAIVESIKRFYENGALMEKMGQKALESIRGVHNWERYGDKYFDFIMDLPKR